MANTVSKVAHLGNGKMYLVTCASAAGATETVTLPAGKALVSVGYPVFTSATPRTAVTFAYVASTGVLTIGALTAADAFTIAIFTD